MHAKLAILGLAGLAAAGHVNPIYPRQTDSSESSTTSADKAEETAKPSMMSPEQCSSKLSSVLADTKKAPLGGGVFHNVTKTFYEEHKDIKTQIPHTDCQWLEAFPTKAIYDAGSFLKSIKNFTDLNKDLVEELTEGCEEWKDGLPLCRNETEEWLLNVVGIGENVLEDIQSGAGALSALGAASLAVVVGALAAVL